MDQKFIISGTDTEIGKTVFSAALMAALLNAGYQANYWKPIQSGVSEGIDTKTVQTLTNLPDEHFIPETYILSEPLSPHRAAEIDNTYIDIDNLEIPKTNGPLIIEGAGGLLVPLTRHILYIDLFKIWNVPVILCTRTNLGTINHTLLSIEALRTRGIPILGLVFIGENNPDNIRTIKEFAEIKILGRLPHLDRLNSESLQIAFNDNFDLGDFIS